MRLSLLVKREPWPTIVEQTLAQFLTRWQQRPQQVHWYPGRPSVAAIRRRGEQPWICNFFLNAIFFPDVQPQVLDPLRREFSRSLTWWRRSAQKLYVNLSFSPLTAPFLAHAALGISPPLEEGRGMVIVPGKHKLRLLDPGQMEVHGILKSGFPPSIMQRELKTRQLAAELGLPVPLLKEVDKDGAWFTEAYVSGTPLNRLTDAYHSRWAVSTVGRHLQSLMEHTLIEETLSAYLNHLEDQLQVLLTEVRLLSAHQRQTLRQMAESLLARLRFGGTGVLPRVPLSLTHGDLQPANILVNDTTVWLIDWEYSALRHLAYDPLVLLGASRAPRGLAHRLLELMDHGAEVAVAAGFLGIKDVWGSPRARQLSFDLFLLEEMALRLQENANPCFLQLDAGLQALALETGRWLKSTT